jgi:hypothetical protein
MTPPREDRTPRARPARRHAALFSTPLEIGLRALIVLDAMRPIAADLQRLVSYDYLLVHSGDVGGPESIHPSTPHRSAEILVKRDVLRAGLQLMLSRDLVAVEMTRHGVRYSATDLTSHFLLYFDGAYAAQLRERARWLDDRFSRLEDDALQALIAQNLDKWGGEFTSEALVRHVSV